MSEFSESELLMFIAGLEDRGKSNRLQCQLAGFPTDPNNTYENTLKQIKKIIREHYAS